VRGGGATVVCGLPEVGELYEAGADYRDAVARLPFVVPGLPVSPVPRHGPGEAGLAQHLGLVPGLKAESCRRIRLEWKYEMCTQTWAVWVRSLAYRRDLVVCVAIGVAAHHKISAWAAHILMVMMR
jgi:hypothetical protein